MTRRALDIVYLLLPLLFLGCAASPMIEKGPGNKYRYFYSMVAPTKSSILLFRDENLLIQFKFDEIAIHFQAQNISRTSLRIDWSKASISLDGTASPVRTVRNFYDSTLTSFASMPIRPLGVLQDVVAPARNVVFDGKRWQNTELLPTTDRNSQAVRETIHRWVGKKVGLVLPIQVGPVVKQYQFTFAVDSVQQMAWNAYYALQRLPKLPSPPPAIPQVEDQMAAAAMVAGFLGFSTYILTAKKIPPRE